MELVIILAVVAVGVWYFFYRDKELVKEATTEAPYKVEDRPHVVDLFGVAVIDTVSSMAQHETKEVTAAAKVEAPSEVGKSADNRVEATVPVVEPVKAERQAKPRAKKGPTAPSKPKPQTKTVATAKPKAPAKPKAASKPKAKPQV
jgi:outer membrane biosynthesis protein TonB